MFKKPRFIFIGILYFLVFDLCGQNLTWMRKDNPDNAPRTNLWSEVTDIARDAIGNVYSSLEYDEAASLYDDNQSVKVSSPYGGGVVVTKYSSGGELIWYRNFDFLSKNSAQISVDEQGNLVMVARISGDFDFAFEGGQIQTELFRDHVFLVKLDNNGNVLSWHYQNIFDDGFQFESPYDILLLEDGRVWLAIGIRKLVPGGGFLRHDVELINLYDSDFRLIKSNKFDPGPHVNFPIRYLWFREFQEFNGSVYVIGYGNGFFGQSKANIFDRTAHSYLLRANAANEFTPHMVTTDPADNLIEFHLHQDNSMTIIGSSPDGNFETDNGNFSTPVETTFLANLSGTSVNNMVNLPRTYLQMRAFENDDNRLAIFGSAYQDEQIETGYGNNIYLPVPERSYRTMIMIYTKEAKLSFFDTYDLPDEEGYVFINDIVADSNCDAFYVAGLSHALVDFDLSEENQVLSDAATNFHTYLFAKYNNERPQIASPDTIKVCTGEDLVFDLNIIDEASELVSLSFTAPNNDFDPAAITALGGGIFRQVQIDGIQAQGNLTIGVRAVDVCGDFNEKEIIIQATQAPAPPSLATSGDYFLCPGDTLTLRTDSSLIKTWSDGSQGDSLRVFGAGEYFASQINELGCVSANSDTLRVVMATNPVIPGIDINGPLEFCDGESVTLTASSTGSVMWSNGATTRSIEVTESGSYSVKEVSPYCGDSEFSDPIEVIVHPIPDPPLITVEGDSRFCEGERVILRSSYATGNTWSTGETSQEIEVTNTGIYSVSVNVNGCQSEISDEISILVDQDFDVRLPTDTTVCGAFAELELEAEVSLQDLDYLWSDGSSLTSLFVSEEGEYWLEVTNGTCVNRAYVQIEEACFPLLFMPSAFSPNRDLSNDTFKPVASRILDFRMEIYNPWGQLLFVSEALDVGWDGTYQQQAVPNGQYVYKVVYTGLVRDDVTSFSKRGGFYLMR